MQRQAHTGDELAVLTGEAEEWRAAEALGALAQSPAVRGAPVRLRVEALD